MNIVDDDLTIAIIGLGYVGLPLAVEFGKIYPTLGFDISQQRIDELCAGHDRTLEVDGAELEQAAQLSFSSQAQAMAACNFFLVTGPTPIDEHKQPDLTPLKMASQTVGQVLRSGAIVVFESTVFPGATEEVCVPILEQESGLVLNQDFYVGYSLSLIHI